MNKTISPAYHSVRKKIVVWMLFVVFSIVIPVDVFDYYQTKQKMLKEIEDLTDQKLLRLAENIQLPLWELDKVWVEKVILAEMMDKYVFAIKVENEKKIFTGKMRNQQWQLVNVSGDIQGTYLKRKIEILYKEGGIGFVYLYVTTKFVEQALLSVIFFKILKILILSLLLVSALNILLRKMVVLPLQNILGVVNDIANGNYKRSVGSVTENDEIGVLTAAMQRMTKSLSQASEAAIAVSEGDYSRQLEVKGENDLFAMSMNNMMLSLAGLVKQIDNVSLGNYESNFDPRSTRDTLGLAVQRMTYALARFDQQQKQQIWLEKSVVTLNDVLREENTQEDLAEKVIKVLCILLGGKVGTLFLAKQGNDRGRLYLTGCYAYTGTGENVRGTYQIGEGVIGQVAMDQSRIILKDIVQDDIKIVSGLGSFSPKTVVISPFSFKQEIYGVVEIGFNNDFSEIQQVFLDRTQEAIASAFERIYIRDSLSTALQQAQIFSEELQVANEEMLVKTDALETQTLQLKKSERISLARAKELEESNRYKSEFLANMSHELRTPLNSLLILAQLLADNEQGRLSEDQVESAQIIKSSGQHLLHLINEILELSKVEAGYMVAQPSEVIMSSLIDILQQRFDPLAKEKRLQFKIIQLTKLPETFVSDDQLLEQVLTNLLGNAIKFTQQGKVLLAIDVVLMGEDEGAKQWLQFEVSDTGIGIPDKQIVNIFSAFHQVDGGFNRRYGGTGLGLSIANAYAELLGGHIEVKSKEHDGSTFTLLLPLQLLNEKRVDCNEAFRSKPVDLERGKDSTIKNPPFADDRYLIDADGSVILVLEGDEKFAKILYQQVKAQGYNCIVSNDAESTIQLVKAYPVSGIILDLCLPGMEGKEFLTQLNATSDIEHIPIHVISVMDDNGMYWKEGVVGYLTKPVTPQKINDALKILKYFDLDGDRRILVVEKEQEQQQVLPMLLEHESAVIEVSSTIEDAMVLINKKTFDCIILGAEFIQESNGFSLLDGIVDNKTIKQPLIIVYISKELNDKAKQSLKLYEERIAVHHQKSPERLKDEITLFLHQVKNKKLKGDNFLAYKSDMRLSGKSVMIVDDDMRNSYALAKALRGAGINVFINSSGQDALNQLAEGIKVDVVLMDIMMPEMDGFEAIKKIRLQKQFEKLPIIAVTAKTMPEDKAHCLQAGANDYLVKPIDLNQLMTMIRAWIMN